MARFGVTEKKERMLKEAFERLGIRETDLEETFLRGSGPGGQKRNKTSSTVMLKHRPTGITVRVDRERSQSVNRFIARRLLAERIDARQVGRSVKEETVAEKIRKQKDRRRRRTRRAKDPT